VPAGGVFSFSHELCVVSNEPAVKWCGLLAAHRSLPVGAALHLIEFAEYTFLDMNRKLQYKYSDLRI
jgi:hypothetical protein